MRDGRINVSISDGKIENYCCKVEVRLSDAWHGKSLHKIDEIDRSIKGWIAHNARQSKAVGAGVDLLLSLHETKSVIANWVAKQQPA